MPGRRRSTSRRRDRQTVYLHRNKREIVVVYGSSKTVSRKDIRFKEILTLWLDNNRVHLKAGTVNKYQQLIEKHILPELGEVHVADISPSIVNSFMMKKLSEGRLGSEGGLSASYVRSMSIVVNSALKYAALEGYCEPFKTPIYKPSLVKKELSILTKEEQKRLETALLEGLNPTKAGIFLSLKTGLRIGEVCALRWEDVDFDAQVIKVRHTIVRIKEKEGKTALILDTPKTKSSLRDIPIFSSLLPVLKQIEKNRKSDFVISSEESFVSPRTYENRYHQVCKQAGIRRVNYHTLRHTFATRCIEAGVDVKSLSEILGHANVGITLNTYVHSSIDMKREQLEKLNTLTE